MTASRNKLMIRGAVAIVLAAVSIFFYIANMDLVQKNKKMLKYIKNEAVYQQDLSNLKAAESLFTAYIIPLEAKPDLEKIKDAHIDTLLRLVGQNRLQLDAYRPEVEPAQDGTTIFRYHLTMSGDFVDVLRFFYALQAESKYMVIPKYDIKFNADRSVQVGVTVEIIGIQG